MIIRKSLLVAATMLLSVCANAQRAVGTWTLQPKAGINIAKMTNTENGKVRWGLVAGAELGYQASPLLSITAGALYSQQGVNSDFDVYYKNSNSQPDGRVETTFKMDYVNIPILANFYVADGLAVKMGIQPGILINDKVEISKFGDSTETGLKDFYRDANADVNIPSVDFAIPLCISYEFSNVVLDARYNLHLTNAISALGESTKHSVFQITLGYKFKL